MQHPMCQAKCGSRWDSNPRERSPNFVGPYCLMCMLKWLRCLCISESDWEDTVTQQMPRTSSPFWDGSNKNLEKLEMEMNKDLDEIDYRARLANDRRKPKPILGYRPTLRRSPQIGSKMTAPHLRLVQEYITMVASLQQTKCNLVWKNTNNSNFFKSNKNS